MRTALLRCTRRRTAAAGVLLAALLAGCGYDATPLPEPEPPEPPAPAAPADCETDERTYASYPPGREEGAALERIRERGRLVVGVSADTYLMSALDGKTARLEGFDTDIAKRIGAEIFGAGYNVGRDLQLRVITAADRIELLQEGELDLVVRNMTINCDRWTDVAFSQVYYDAEQKVLVRADLRYDDPRDLADVRVCAPLGSTSLDNIEAEEPDAIIEPADTHTGCLVKFQQGEVDAITGDDTVLAGLAAQDPYAVVPEDQPHFSDEPYGIAANLRDTDLVQFVNAVLEEMRADGSWQRLYDKWLRPHLGDAAQPRPVTPYRPLPS